MNRDVLCAFAALVALSTVHAATIRGSVKFHGSRPKMPLIDFSSNPQCEREHRGHPAYAETVVVNRNGTLRNTLIWISKGVPAGFRQPPFTPAKLDQVGCVYRPHVLALMVGQELAVSNSDPVNHSVHAESTINAASNETEPPRSDTVRRRFRREEVWFPITCGVHPWMRALVAVISHPFYAVTGDDGSFTISGLPAGRYVIEAVHERFGRKQQTLELSDQQTTPVNFTFGN